LVKARGLLQRPQPLATQVLDQPDLDRLGLAAWLVAHHRRDELEAGQRSGPQAALAPEAEVAVAVADDADRLQHAVRFYRRRQLLELGLAKMRLSAIAAVLCVATVLNRAKTPRPPRAPRNSHFLGVLGCVSETGFVS
jgi:hypothetical protein